MALTTEIIKANEKLAALPEDQLQAIVTLSKNDEDTVIAKKIGEHHGKIETDVKEVSGVDKKEGEKSYDYMKRAMTTFKEKAESADELQKTIDTNKTTIADLQKKIADGNTDEALKQQLKDAQDAQKAAQNSLATKEKEWKEKNDQLTTDMQSMQVNGEFGKATAGLKFKAAFTEDIQKTLVSSAQTAILGKYSPDWVDDGKGGKVMVYRTKDDAAEIARNPANGLNPFTTEELVKAQLKDSLDSAPVKPGGGTNNPNNPPTPDPVQIADIGSAKTQVEADKLIVKHLLQKGLTKDHEDFSTEQKKIRDENSVSKLPLR